MRILNIAEKPSVAKSISMLLASYTSTPSLCKYTPNHTFTLTPSDLNNNNNFNNNVINSRASHTNKQDSSVQMVFTSLLGHLFTHDFTTNTKNWRDSDPADLFTAPISSKLEGYNVDIACNLISHLCSVSAIVVWTDCDREGENIAKEVRDLLVAAKRLGVGSDRGGLNKGGLNKGGLNKGGLNRMLTEISNNNDNSSNSNNNLNDSRGDSRNINNSRSITNSNQMLNTTGNDTRGISIFNLSSNSNMLLVKRARFNAITRPIISNALHNLVDINMHESDAVDVRMELDLRIGSAFTRLQTLNLDRRGVVSYGPCQVPTLGFVVQRMEERDYVIFNSQDGISIHTITR